MEPFEAAQALLEQCQQAGLTARLVGGLGVRFVSPSAANPPFARTYNDVDVVIIPRQARSFTQAAEKAGFEPDKRFNSLQGDKRMLFHMGEMPLDVFVGVFEQCHNIDLAPRLPKTLPSIAVDDLLLTKMQVVQLTEKDMSDTLALLQDHEFGEAETDFNISRLAAFLASDWGWYTTVTDNLQKLADWTQTSVTGIATAPLLNKVSQILQLAEREPKSFKWKMRARVGRRVPWYQLPEEKAR